jgi:universal stress protein E
MKRFNNILYFADGAPQVCPALRRAIGLAQSNQARLTVMDVLPPAEPAPELHARLGMELNDVLRERRQAQLEELLAPLQEPDCLIYTRVLTGTPFVEVIRSVLRGGHDLVIKAARPPKGVSEHLFGSTDLHLMRKCPCPVWVDRPGAQFPYRSVLAAVDPTAESARDTDRLVMDLATSLAERESARLHVVHAWRLYGESMLRSGRARISNVEVDLLLEQTRLRHRERLDGLLGHYGLSSSDPGVRLVQREPAPGILETARADDVDLIVMGTVGRSGIPGFFIGNTAEEVLQCARASILSVKPPGFQSPVTLP